MVSGKPNRNGSDAESVASLARTLRTLKRRGSALLIVGLVSERNRRRLCGRLLGDDTAGPRRRLLVIADTDSTAVVERARRAQRPPADTVEHLAYTTEPRAASNDRPTGRPLNETAPEPTEGEGEREHELETRSREPERETSNESELPPGARRVGGDGLTGLAGAIEAEIDAIEAESDGFVPAELRVCLDSLAPLLDAYDREAVVGFLDRITTRIKAAKGMGHVHLPVSRDWEVIPDVRGTFDAVVELRVERGRAQQRWHLRDGSVSSEWFPI